MSSFGTFLTDRPYRRRNRRKVDLHQRFLRESNRHFPKAIRPKVNVNVNPVVQYMSSQNQEAAGYQTTMQYKNCSQIVPTEGLTNLVFYDCHKKKSTDRSIVDSTSKCTTPSSSPATDYRHGSEFFASEVIIESSQNGSEIFGDATNKSHEWIADNFGEFVSVPQTLSDRSAQDFTVTSNVESNFLSIDVNSYTSFEMDLNQRLTYDKDISNDLPHSDILSFELNLDDPTSRLDDIDSIHLPDDTFELDSNRLSSLIDTHSVGTLGFCSQSNSSDCHMTTIASLSEDESMAKFGVSSCSDISSDLSAELDYADFAPLLTSTPKSRGKMKDRKNANYDLSEVNGLFVASDEELLFNQQEQVGRPATNFTFSDQLDSYDFFL